MGHRAMHHRNRLQLSLAHGTADARLITASGYAAGEAPPSKAASSRRTPKNYLTACRRTNARAVAAEFWAHVGFGPSDGFLDVPPARDGIVGAVAFSVFAFVEAGSSVFGARFADFVARDAKSFSEEGDAIKFLLGNR